MRKVPDSYAADLRSQGSRPTSGPGPNERGRVKQGMSPGKWPGTRTSGNQGPGAEKDNSARKFGDALARRGSGG